MPPRAWGRPSRAPSSPGTQAHEDPPVNRLDRIEGFGDVAEQRPSGRCPLHQRTPTQTPGHRTRPTATAASSSRSPAARPPKRSDGDRRASAVRSVPGRRTAPALTSGRRSLDSRRSNSGPAAGCDRPDRSRKSLSLMLLMASPRGIVCRSNMPDDDRDAVLPPLLAWPGSRAALSFPPTLTPQRGHSTCPRESGPAWSLSVKAVLAFCSPLRPRWRGRRPPWVAWPVAGPTEAPAPEWV